MTKTKKIILVLIVIVVVFIGYKMFFSSNSSDNTTLVASNSSTNQFADGQAILALLDKLNQVTLDTSIFSDKVFVSLVSFAQAIPDQVVGRANPFLPIGQDSAVSTPSQSTTTAGAL